MAAIPDDVIPNILSRLPVTSLLRFKSVSKFWYSLIKSSNFTKLHLNQTLSSTTYRHVIASYSSLSSAQFEDQDENPTHLNFFDLDHPLKNNSEAVGGFKFLGSSNGVVLVLDSNHSNIFLFNPCTKSHRKLPSLETRFSDESRKFYGLGYDVTSDDYKVLRVVEFYGPNSNLYYESNVYSLRHNSWKHLDHVPYNLLYEGRCVFVEQGLHYLVYDPDLDNHRIVRFDFEKEDMSIIEVPKYEFGFVRLSLAALDGCLCMLVVYIDGVQEVECWVMKEYGKKESWAKMCCICTKENIGLKYLIRLIVKSKDGRRVLVEVDHRELYWCDLKANKVERVQAEGLPVENELLFVGVYVESLVSLDEEEVLVGEHQVQLRRFVATEDENNSLSASNNSQQLTSGPY